MKKNPKPLPDEVVQGDQPDEQTQPSRKDRKGKKNKNKRDRGSEGKGKRRGKGKKGSRRKKHEENQHEENQLEGGFLRASTALPVYPSQESFQATQLPEIQKGLETLIAADDFGKFLTSPTGGVQPGTEAPTEVPDSSVLTPVNL